MNIFVLFALCFLPLIAVFTIVAFIPKEKEILKYAISCLFGILTIAPASFIQFFVLKIPAFNSNSFFSILITAIIFNGLIEESFKLGFLFLIPRKKQTIFTYFICSILLGISAGSIETAIYVINSLQKITLITGTDTALKLIFTRMFSSQALHAFCAGLSGIFIWGCKKELRHLIIFLYSVSLHGLYNFFIAFSTDFRYFAISAIFMAAVECRIWYKKLKKNEFFLENQLTENKESDIL